MRPVGPAEPYPSADALELFEGQAAPGAFSLGHDRVGDDVVLVRRVPLLSAGTRLDPPLGGLGALLLQLPPQVMLALAIPVQAAPCGHVAGGRVAMLTMPRSTPMKPSGSHCSASGYLARGVEAEHVIALDDVRSPFRCCWSILSASQEQTKRTFLSRRTWSRWTRAAGRTASSTPVVTAGQPRAGTQWARTPLGGGASNPPCRDSRPGCSHGFLICNRFLSRGRGMQPLPVEKGVGLAGADQGVRVAASTRGQPDMRELNTA